MPQGLQLRNASGQLILDTNDVTSTTVAQFNTGTSDGSYTVPGLTDIPGTIVLHRSSRNGGLFYAYPTLTRSGNTFSWTFPAPNPPNPQYREALRVLVTVE